MVRGMHLTACNGSWVRLIYLKKHRLQCANGAFIHLNYFNPRSTHQRPKCDLMNQLGRCGAKT